MAGNGATLKEYLTRRLSTRFYLDPDENGDGASFLIRGIPRSITDSAVEGDIRAYFASIGLEYAGKDHRALEFNKNGRRVLVTATLTHYPGERCDSGEELDRLQVEMHDLPEDNSTST